MQRCATQLSTCAESLPVEAADRARKVAQDYGSLGDTILRVLSNHGSEWIEQGLLGCLTYAEFARIRTSDVRGFVLGIERMLNMVEIERPGRWSPEAIEGHRRQMLLDAGMLDELAAIGRQIAVMFGPRSS